MSSRDLMMDKQICRKCGLSKPVTQFHFNKSKSHGRSSVCRVCLNAARRSSPTGKNQSGKTTNLVALARKGRWDEVEGLLQNVTSPPPQLLSLVAEQSDERALRITQALLAKNVPQTSSDRHGDQVAACVVAARHGNERLLEVLPISDESQHVMVTAALGNLAKMKPMKRDGVDLCVRDRAGFTALHHCAYSYAANKRPADFVGMVHFLLEAGISADAESSSIVCRTPLCAVGAGGGCVAIAEALIAGEQIRACIARCTPLLVTSNDTDAVITTLQRSSLQRVLIQMSSLEVEPPCTPLPTMAMPRPSVGCLSMAPVPISSRQMDAPRCIMPWSAMIRLFSHNYCWLQELIQTRLTTMASGQSIMLFKMGKVAWRRC
jgi:hypothetical protein